MIGDSPTKIRISPERSGPNSQKSSAHNSVGSSFSDLSGKRRLLNVLFYSIFVRGVGVF